MRESVTVPKHPLSFELEASLAILSRIVETVHSSHSRSTAKGCHCLSPMSMSWSPESAANAYTDTLKLCKIARQKRYTTAGTEPHSTEFIAALAAGIEAKLIVEVSACAGPSTIALAVAARQTGGRLICILSNSQVLLDAMVAMKELGLSIVVEFIIGDAEDILPQYVDVDFALVDCRKEHYVELFEVFRFNSRRAVVVADNLFGRKATAAYEKIIKNRPGASSITLPIGRGIEITRLSRAEDDSQQGRRLTKRVSWAMDLEKMYTDEFMQC